MSDVNELLEQAVKETENLRNVYLMLFHSLCAVVWDLLTHISISGIIKRPAKLSS